MDLVVHRINGTYECNSNDCLIPECFNSLSCTQEGFKLQSLYIGRCETSVEGGQNYQLTAAEGEIRKAGREGDL